MCSSDLNDEDESRERDEEDEDVEVANDAMDTGDSLGEKLLNRISDERDYEGEDLGKFGLGLKTASLSQCERFTVASRSNPSRADINAYCWDVEHVDVTNRWEILPVRTADLHEGVRQHLIRSVADKHTIRRHAMPPGNGRAQLVAAGVGIQPQRIAHFRAQGIQQIGRAHV